ncbi:ABC transporter permease [uncultured Imperialibacter sp.]|uniref:ABC transporter permease n=1 Tax=uncultured Imperialibacter sp. TaxID=1672639 RepID=UPI0030D71C96|tara:strand:- start:23413 stop:26088 length:2676 start_codon:yes stop_codon:yes gene_type:complete
MNKRRPISSPVPRNDGPPRWASRLLEWYCKPSLFEDLQGDLLEYFERNMEKRGVARARLIYIIDVFKFLRPYTVRKPQILKGMNQFILFANYFKASLRTMSRSKLFTALNVAGLAISMSVGLLLIALLHDIYQVDDFHTKKDRIYRIISERQDNDLEVTHFASSSWLASNRVKTEVPGVEEVVVLHADLGGDVTWNDKTVDLHGFWASPAFFEVFSFELLKGNPHTVLDEPNAVVITEESATRLFGEVDPIGKSIAINNDGPYKDVEGNIEGVVTGVVKDVPTNSHIQFDLLLSYNNYLPVMKARGGRDSWLAMANDFVYVLLDESNNRAVLDNNLARISGEENEAFKEDNIFIEATAQPFTNIIPGPHLINWRGPVLEAKNVWSLVGLVLVVMVSACFNYTNLSIARSLSRAKEVGVRKVIGAGRSQIASQFVVESIVISLVSLCFAIALFWPIRHQFLQLDEFASGLVSLNPSPILFALFGVFAVGVGVLAGIVPALSFSKLKPVGLAGALKGAGMKGLTIRRLLIIFQYAFSIAFITLAALAYQQFQYAVNFDLGYKTDNVINVDLQGHSPSVLAERFSQIPRVIAVAQSASITSTQAAWFTKAKYGSPPDSVSLTFNAIDENYIPLLGHQLMAGENFHHLARDAESQSVIVNEQFVKRFQMGSPEEAIGEMVDFYGKKEAIVGVVKDFHYGTLESEVGPYAFRYVPRFFNTVNLKIEGSDVLGTMEELEDAWKEVDPIHPFQAEFYDKSIEKVYREYLTMVKVVGYLAILSISIALLGLLGMVVFTTESRLKEIGIRKVLGASEQSLVYLLGKGFVILLLLAALSAIPGTVYLFKDVVLREVIYKAPLGWFELLGGALFVLAVALLAIGIQTLKAARTNPANILRSE